MKPDKDDSVKDGDNPDPVTGDVIGDTAYSERFVLKILLKLANLDTLKDEINEKSFEDDLCVLWDMTAERDVVLFLLKHDVLKLFNFALPGIESPRIIEIIVGIIGNMCCQKEAVAVLMKMNDLLNVVIEYINTDDSLILIQLLRLISGCLFLANDEEITIWMDLFKNLEYATPLYFMLNNSSNKDLLIIALENLNTICSYCNTEKFRGKFFSHFISTEAFASLLTAFTEIVVTQKDQCNKDEIERIIVISLQISLNFIGFDKSPELFENCIENVLKMIDNTLNYYENKLVDHKEIDTDLVDVIESTNTIIKALQIKPSPDTDKYVETSYNIWKATLSITNSEKNGFSFENEEDELKELATKMKLHLSTLICSYLANCSDENVLKVLDLISTDYDDIITMITDNELKTAVCNRSANYRTRLKENIDS